MVRQTLPIRFYFLTELAGEARRTRFFSINGGGAKAMGKAYPLITTKFFSPGGHQHGQVPAIQRLALEQGLGDTIE